VTESPIWQAEGETPSLSEPPERSAGDYAHSVVKAGLGLIPLAGAPLSEAFDVAIGTPLDKRRDDWIRRIGEGLEELQQRFKGFDPAHLAENEAFVSTAYQATQAVMRTHHEEKREALKNAVLNSAIRTDLNEDLQQTFVGLIDTLTPWHLRLLRLFQDPAAGLGNRFSGDWTSTSLTQVAELAFPELRGQSERYNQIVRELHAHGLMAIETLGGTMTSRGTLEKRTTTLGDGFLEFISAPTRKMS
jgi:hypothetical protein